jgi:hypothetical protein
MCATEALFSIFSSRILSLSHLILHCHKNRIAANSAQVAAANNENARLAARAHLQRSLDAAVTMLQPIDTFLSTLAESQDLAVSGIVVLIFIRYLQFVVHTTGVETQARDFNDLVMSLTRSKLELKTSFPRK